MMFFLRHLQTGSAAVTFLCAKVHFHSGVSPGVQDLPGNDADDRHPERQRGERPCCDWFSPCSFSELKIKTDWRLKRWFCFKCENPSWSRRTGSCRSHAAVTLLLLEAGRIKLCIFLRLLSSSRNCSQSRFCAMVLFYTSGSSQFGRQWWGVGILRSGCISACQCTPCFQVF